MFPNKIIWVEDDMKTCSVCGKEVVVTRKKKIEKIKKKKRDLNSGGYMLEYTKGDLGNKLNEIIEKLNEL